MTDTSSVRKMVSIRAKRKGTDPNDPNDKDRGRDIVSKKAETVKKKISNAKVMDVGMELKATYTPTSSEDYT